MELEILIHKPIQEGKHWLVARTKLFDYLSSIDEDKFHFEVQRKIVKNIYLDKLIETLKLFEPIPFITLTVKTIISNFKNQKLNVDSKSMEILDGLQRTYRLWVYWKIYQEVIKKNSFRTIQEFMKKVKEIFPEFFEKGVINSKILKMLFENEKELKRIFYEYDVYFVIWVNLSESEIIKKMLVLNAGQKPVSSKHQFELLFLHLLKEIEPFLSQKNIKIYREKDKDFSRLKRDRHPGEYVFSTIITSLLSLVLAKPQRVSSELIYKYDLMDEEKSLSYAQDVFNKNFVEKILDKLLELDKKYQHNKAILQWLGKDTTLTGIFAGIGKYIGFDKVNVFSPFPKEKVVNTLDELIKKFPEDLHIEEFNRYYDSLAGRSLNIGEYIRKVVQQYTLLILKKGEASWKDVFLMVDNEKSV